MMNLPLPDPNPAGGEFGVEYAALIIARIPHRLPLRFVYRDGKWMRPSKNALLDIDGALRLWYLRAVNAGGGGAHSSSWS